MNIEQMKDSQKTANSIRTQDIKHDLRFIKTEAGIQTAFLSLLKEKKFEEITIQNLLDVALINRKTFYNHYLDKYELLEKMTNELFEELLGYLANRTQQAIYSDTFFEDSERIYKELNHSRDKILTLWDININNSSVYNRLLDYFKDEYIHMVKDAPNDCDLSFQSSLFASIQMCLLNYVLESKEPLSCQKMKNEFKVFSKTINESTKLNTF